MKSLISNLLLEDPASRPSFNQIYVHYQQQIDEQPGWLPAWRKFILLDINLRTQRQHLAVHQPCFTHRSISYLLIGTQNSHDRKHHPTPPHISDSSPTCIASPRRHTNSNQLALKPQFTLESVVILFTSRRTRVKSMTMAQPPQPYQQYVYPSISANHRLRDSINSLNQLQVTSAHAGNRFDEADLGRRVDKALMVSKGVLDSTRYYTTVWFNHCI
jgi:hypothetical protein